MVKGGAFSHQIDYVSIFLELLNLKGHLICFIGSKVTTILVNGGILPSGGVALGRVCACILRSGLVSLLSSQLNLVEQVAHFHWADSVIKSPSLSGCQDVRMFVPLIGPEVT